MRRLSGIIGGLRAVLRRTRVEAELDDELREYLAAAVDAKLAAGLPREEAVRQARAEMGSAAAVKDWVRDAGWESRLESIWQDFRHAARNLRRSPGFTVAATVTLALGIGATTAIFTIVDAVILRPLPIANPDRVVSLQVVEPRMISRTVTYPTFERIREQSPGVFGAVAAAGDAGVRVTAGGDTRQALATFVTPRYFDVLGIQPSRGRSFAPHEHAAGAPPVAIVSDAFWRARMGAAPDVLGRPIQVANTDVTVVGIAPRGFRGLELSSPVDVFMPLMTTALVLPPANYLHEAPAVIGGVTYSPQWWMDVIGRLRPGVSAAQAQASLSATRVLPPVRGSSGPWDIRLVPAASAALASGTQSDTRRFATLLGAVVTLVLLVGCANLSGLLIARIEQRRRETAMRMALGAGTGRIARLFLAESLLLSTAGGLGGLLLAHWMLQVMNGFVIPGGIRLESLQLGLTGRVIPFSVGAALFTALVSGVLPAVLGSRVDLASGLAPRIVGSAPARGRARAVLVAAQVALSLILVVGAALFVRSARAALATDVGADTSRVAYATVSFWTAGYDEPRLARFNQAVRERLGDYPGVERATFGQPPLAGFPGSTPAFRIDGVDRQLPQTLTFASGPGYFSTIGIDIVAGRALTADDERPTAPPAVVANEAFARYAWPGQNPLGRHVFLKPGGPEFEVVGVARDGKYASLREEGRLALYIPWHLARRHAAAHRETFIVRAAGDAAPLVPLLRQAVREVDPNLPVFASGTLAERIAELAMTQRMGASLLGWYGTVALALAIAGIYGLVAYGVARRTSEIGVHIALGAQPAEVVRRMMRGALLPVGAGVVAGLGGAFLLSRFAATFLFDVAPHDVVSFTTAALLLGGAAALASYIPARRAARVDPVAALRAE